MPGVCAVPLCSQQVSSQKWVDCAKAICVGRSLRAVWGGAAGEKAAQVWKKAKGKWDPTGGSKKSRKPQ